MMSFKIKHAASNCTTTRPSFVVAKPFKSDVALCNRFPGSLNLEGHFYFYLFIQDEALYRRLLALPRGTRGWVCLQDHDGKVRRKVARMDLLMSR